MSPRGKRRKDAAGAREAARAEEERKLQSQLIASDKEAFEARQRLADIEEERFRDAAKAAGRTPFSYFKHIAPSHVLWRGFDEIGSAQYRGAFEVINELRGRRPVIDPDTNRYARTKRGKVRFRADDFSWLRRNAAILRKQRGKEMRLILDGYILVEDNKRLPLHPKSLVFRYTDNASLLRAYRELIELNNQHARAISSRVYDVVVREVSWQPVKRHPVKKRASKRPAKRRASKRRRR